MYIYILIYTLPSALFRTPRIFQVEMGSEEDQLLAQGVGGMAPLRIYSGQIIATSHEFCTPKAS